MPALLGASLLVVGFVALVKAFGLVARGAEAVASSRLSVSIVKDAELSDLEKEKALQAHALRLFGLFARLAVGGAVAFLAPAGVVWALSRVGIFSFPAVIDVAVSWPFILASSVAVTGILWLLERA